MPLYTVEIYGSSADLVSVRTPSVTFVAVDRIVRRGVNPQVLDAVIYEIRVEGATVRADTPAASVTAATALWDRFLVRAQPSYLKIEDSTGTVLGTFGEINTASAWEDLEIVGPELLPSAQQLMAGVTFNVTFRARRNYVDSNDVCGFEQTLRTSYGPDGLSVQRLETRLRVSHASGKTLETAAIAALGRLTAASGYVRTVGNSALGVEIHYDRYPLRTEGLLVSEVQQLGGGLVLPDLAGDGTIRETASDVLELGLRERGTRAEIVGSTAPLDWVESQQPDGSVGRTEHDQRRRVASGDWAVVEVIGSPLGAKVSRVKAALRLFGGGRPVEEFPGSFNLSPLLRHGSHRAWRLEERVEVYALGPLEWADVPTLAPLPAPWVLAEPDGEEGLPTVFRPAQNADQRVWLRVTRRLYLWGGEGHPLASEELRALALRSYYADDSVGLARLVV